MSPKERVDATFAQQRPDRIAVHHIGFSSAVASQILGHEAYVGGGIQQWREAVALWDGPDAHQEYLERSRRDAFELALAVGNDIVRMEYWRMSAKPTRRIDAYTFLYGDPEGSWLVRRFDPETELYQVVDQHPPPQTNHDPSWLEVRVEAEERALERYYPTVESFAHTRELIETYGKEHRVRVSGAALGIPYDPAIWLEAVVLRPDLVARHLNVQTERALRAIPHLAAVGVKYLFGGGDFASNEGPFYSPHAFQVLMLPRLKRISEACHVHGLCYLFASDGDLWPLADMLFGESGIDGYYEIDGRAGMDLARLRQRFPHLTLIGNISSHTLHLGTRDEVIAETRACLDAARTYGGILVGVSNYLMPGTPMRNVEAMLRTIELERTL